METNIDGQTGGKTTEITTPVSDEKNKSFWESWWRPALSVAFALLCVTSSFGVTATTAQEGQLYTTGLVTAVVMLATSVSIAITSLERQRKGSSIIKIGLAAAFIALIASVGSL